MRLPMVFLELRPSLLLALLVFFLFFWGGGMDMFQVVPALWLAFYGIRPHCAILSQFLELELLLLLVLLAYALAAWGLGP